MYISAAPLKWINIENGSCLWPPKKGKERKEIIGNADPGKDWLLIMNINILGKYVTYSEALYHEKKKMNSSSESSQDESQKRKKKRNFKYRDNSVSPPPVMDRVDEDDASSISLSGCSSIWEDQMSSRKAKCGNKNMPSKHKAGPSKIEQNEIPVKNYEEYVQTAESCSNTITTTEAIDNNFEAIVKNANIVFEELSNDFVAPEFVPEEDNAYMNLDQLIVILEDIKLQQQIILERTERIESALLQTREPTRQDCTLTLPFKDVADIGEFEEKLLTDGDLRNTMLNLLQYVGGGSNKICISRCLEKVFSSYVGQFCCWTGKRGNFKVRNLSMLEIIKNAVKVYRSRI